VAIQPTLTGLYVGTSGFSYPSWKPDFYPPGTKSTDFLRFYAGQLRSVELNTTFYGLPEEEHVRAWAEQTPEDFRFSVKMSREITHAGRLALLPTFIERMRALGDRLGPILIQFPPTRPRDEGLLALYLGSLDPALRYAFEFRNDSWKGVDIGSHALVGSIEGASPFRYLRLREPPYDEAALASLAGRLRPLLEDGVEVYAYFKHEDEPTGPHYARRLAELVSLARSAGSLGVLRVDV
jgi:uncharacterized protein YecE (DUF72 family)